MLKAKDVKWEYHNNPFYSADLQSGQWVGCAINKGQIFYWGQDVSSKHLGPFL